MLFDYAGLAIVGFSVLLGVIRGLVREVRHQLDGLGPVVVEPDHATCDTDLPLPAVHG